MKNHCKLIFLNINLKRVKSLIEINTESPKPHHGQKVSIDRQGTPIHHKNIHDPPMLQKANSYATPSPINANFKKSKDLKFHRSETSTNQSTINQAELALLEESNLSLKKELERITNLYNQEKNNRESLEQQIQNMKQSNSQIESEFQNLKEKIGLEGTFSLTCCASQY